MLEGLCRPNIYDQCIKITGQAPLVWLKSEKGIKHWEYDGFYSYTDRFTVWWDGLAKKLVKQPSGSPLRLAASLFSNHGEKICDAYVKERFGTWEQAIKDSGTFDNLVKGFESYFAERKERFMAKTDEIIAQMPKGMTKTGKIRTNSHGGVANLLKVLTKTMHEQGSSIRTIAKVQYTICTQAGIYVPDEFITDVLVAADMTPEVFADQ
jgi:hypothetical protein